MEIFVGNLSFAATEDDLKKLFEGFGNVASVTVLMRKEKKIPKSRGFGFVQMPDEQQALAAIAALNGKEFMERVINVEPARPKIEARPEKKLEEEEQPQPIARVRRDFREEREEKKPWYTPVYKRRPKPGSFKGGRRTQSYAKRLGLSGLPLEDKPRKRSEDNPMRWRKNKPWQKSPGEHKPWQKTEGEARPPWRRAEGGVKPWQKKSGEHKPWKKTEGEARPWKRSEGEPKPWRKSEGRVKPWQKKSGEHKPWKRSASRTASVHSAAKPRRAK